MRTKKKHPATCRLCGAAYETADPKRSKYCSRSCSGKVGHLNRVKQTGTMRRLLKGSLPYRVALYLDENGVATEEEVAAHLGVSVTNMRMRMAPSRNRGRPALTERVMMLTALGKKLVQREEPYEGP